ncbi:MAG: formyl transferase [Chitinophagales bacterium]|nr:formyl transferase [Chitinophagales bacterium]MCO5247783.1 formyl transferase [Chitinophagales bacterium]MCZ2392865.1 formyl transferase [Chitinophagales bacterium]
MGAKKIIMLACNGQSTRIMFHGVNEIYPIHSIVIEDKPNRKTFLKNRIKKIGYWKVFGQIIFQLFIPRLLNRISKQRIQEIINDFKIDTSFIPTSKIINVSSVNSNECIEYLIAENPDIVIVNGTRIISKKVLNAINAIFINTHAGITPKYRGVHGGYWALVNNDKDNCGVTVHLVDEGIDTGGVLFQDIIKVSKNDNFITYPLLQVAKGVQLMQKTIESIYNNALTVIESKVTESKLWTHPTIWEYLKCWILKGVK